MTKLIEVANDKELIDLFRNLGVLKNEMNCLKCSHLMKIAPYKKNIDCEAWRCCNRQCPNFLNYSSIRKESKLENFRISLRDIIKILIHFAAKTQVSKITDFCTVGRQGVKNVTKFLKTLIPAPNFEVNKLGGPGKTIQIDETMLNYKCKSHRGRSSTNQTDCLCIVELGPNLKRVFAKVIENKRMETLMPIICSQVASGSIISTDEHKSYVNLGKVGYTHKTVCHKYNFVNPSNSTNTQTVESFNNMIKYEIKKRKGVLTTKRQEFLNEICFFYNNKNNILAHIISLLKY